MTWVFETDCTNSDGPSINAMTRGATQVTYRTMQRVLGKVFTEKQDELGYDTGHERGGLRMRKDWAVSYYKSTYRGQPCYYFAWSHIEHIFTNREDVCKNCKRPFGDHYDEECPDKDSDFKKPRLDFVNCRGE